MSNNPYSSAYKQFPGKSRPDTPFRTTHDKVHLIWIPFSYTSIPSSPLQIKKETKKDGITLYENHLNSIITSQFSTSVKSTPSRPPQRRTLYLSYYHSSRRKHRRGVCRGDYEVPFAIPHSIRCKFSQLLKPIFPLLKRNTSLL